MDDHIKDKLKEKNVGLIPKHVLEARGDIGFGAFGSVCKAYHNIWKKEVAVKIINITDRLTEKDERKFLNEAELMLKLRHEHILYIYGACIDSTGTTPVYGIVMHYMENGSVKSFFQNLEDQTSVPWCIKYRLLYEVIEGVIYLHSNRVLHLDLKAANVLLSEDLHAQICDFGLSKWNKMSVTGSNMTTSVGGTLTHFPPECLKDVHTKPSTQFDVYSYSIYMWEVLTGKQAYENVQNIPQLTLAVANGQRPDMSLIPSDPPDSCHKLVVPLMKRCWSDDSDARASVPEIIYILKPLYDAHKIEAQQAVPALIKCLHASQSEVSVATMGLEDYVASKFGRRVGHSSTRANGHDHNLKVTVGNKPVNKKNIQSMSWSNSDNRSGEMKKEAYVVKLGDHSDPSSIKAVENRIKTERGGMTTMNQINVTGGSKLHIGDIHVRQYHKQTSEDDIEVNESPQPERNNIDVIDGKAVVADTHLHQIAPRLGKCWKLMGRRCLLFEDGDLDALEADYSSTGLVEVITQMLRKWKEKHGIKATRKWLATALIFVRKEHLVDILNDGVTEYHKH